MPDTMIDTTRLRYGVGQSVPRQEDPVLLRGEGRYTDDLALPGQAWGVMVRSPYPHGIIRGIGTEAALAMPGVLGVYTGADMADYAGLKCAFAFKNRDGTPYTNVSRPILPQDKVRFVGDPVALVVAETRMQAKDAAEMVELDIDALDAVTDAVAASQPGAPQVFDEVPNNLVLDFHFGDAAKTAAAFAGAAHTVKLDIRNNRIVVCPMEPRSAIAAYDDGRYVLRMQSQGVFGMRNLIANILKVPTGQVQILTGNVGGSFGMKSNAYPEYTCLLHAARALGRPVKWTDERTGGSFLSDGHGRDNEVTAELALDKDGRFLAVRLTTLSNLGAYLSNTGPNMSTGNFIKNIQSNYSTPLIEISTRCLLSNVTPIVSYRGAGRPESNYFMERLIETAAAEMGIDAIDLRRRNHIRPDQLPYASASESLYDSGDFSAVLDDALAEADWDGFAARAEDSAARGKLRGRGIGNFLECTGVPSKEMGGIRFNDDGTVTIVTGTLDYGQGHWTAFAQVLQAELGVPFEKIKLLQGDSDQLIAGGGTGGSKSLIASGTAIVEASALVVEKGKLAAAHVLEASVADIEFAAGRFSVAGTDLGIDIMELSRTLRVTPALPDEVPRSLDVSHLFDQVPMAFPNGCHIAEVEIDPDTGQVQVVRYHAVNDFGTIVNPMLVQGQVHGGIAQGIGQAIMEHVEYTQDGQMLTGSFTDYALPRASDLPSFALSSHPVPATSNPLGAKGCGEAGCAGSLPAVMNAVVDALKVYGITHINMPVRAEQVWAAIQAAKPG
ncbi:xanthine dehydrogenase family protein molybdopterin-binding subunit [Humitalea sp. 24SJ18S-53]|uniref:xanthine dehydrogenase family protein molybdopterin-binding subunit n=1 Tax=Humitalea sp. 24SJ18S-53 TaxID=3422307 RepID=UPI003D6641CC